MKHSQQQQQEHEQHDHEYGRQKDHCLSIPPLARVNYFHGQMLGVKEFKDEQAYFYEKHRLHNRFLHGYGVVCGLAVKPCVVRPDPCAPTVPQPQPPPPPPPSDKPPESKTPEQQREQPPGAVVALVPMESHVPQQRIAGRPCVEIECGLALTCEGDEVVVRAPRKVDLWHELSIDDQKELASGAAHGVWIKICYRPSPTQNSRPIQLDNCTGMPSNCVPARLRDDVCVKVELARPNDKPHSCACSPCTDCCEEPCLVLALVRHVHPGWMVLEHDIDNTVRRPISLYETTRVSGISWTHGATYSRDEADKILDHGIEIRFSQAVHGETITPGVVELWGIEGGDGRSGQIFNIGGEFVGGQPRGLVHSVRYRRNTRERLNEGDRVLIIFRSAFVLDHCCRPVDGEHIGGRVPIIMPEYEEWERAPVHTICDSPAHREYRPWRSGNGLPGGTFESWLFID